MSGSGNSWIDLDQDGEFDTTDEMVFDTEGRSNDPVNASLTLPTSATVGPTRMRVVMRYNDAPRAPACEPNYADGETEDYCVNLVVGPTSVGHEVRCCGDLQFYPQPADQQLFVRLPDHIQREGMMMVVLDAAGRTISTTYLASSATWYRLATWRTGCTRSCS